MKPASFLMGLILVLVGVAGSLAVVKSLPSVPDHIDITHHIPNVTISVVPGPIKVQASIPPIVIQVPTDFQGQVGVNGKVQVESP